LWPTVVLSVTSVLLFAGASLAETGLVASSGTVAGPLSAFGSGGAVSNSHIKSALSGSDCASGWTFFWTFCLPQIGLPSGLTCFLPIPLPIVVNEAIFGPGCGVIPSSEVAAVNLANAHVAAQNLMTTLFNYLNVTNSGTANVNATFQELLSYYESRAEAIIPYFVGQPWNQTMYDFIATLSGLVPSLEGIEGSFASQQYQDWNATAAGWDIAFGSGGTFDATTAQWDINETGTFSGNFPVAFNGYDVNVTRPYEYWTTYASGGTGGPTIYFNMAPGGTIVDANYAKQSGTGWQGNFTVFDLTQGTHFFVPSESYGNWANGTIPLEAKLHNVSQFDLLKMVCNTNCSSSTLETDFAYAFENNTNLPLGSQNQNTMIPMVNVLNPAAGIYWPVPSTRFNTCIAFSGPGNPPCDTSVTATGGNSIELSSGPGQAIGGNKTFLAFAETAQSLVNNTMTMAYDYWLTLRAITENGTYAIPPNCAIPTPSDAFPSATDYTNYKLSANDVEAVYLAYLRGGARVWASLYKSGELLRQPQPRILLQLVWLVEVAPEHHGLGLHRNESDTARVERYSEREHLILERSDMAGVQRRPSSPLPVRVPDECPGREGLSHSAEQSSRRGPREIPRESLLRERGVYTGVGRAHVRLPNGQREPLVRLGKPLDHPKRKISFAG